MLVLCMGSAQQAFVLICRAGLPGEVFRLTTNACCLAFEIRISNSLLFQGGLSLCFSRINMGRQVALQVCSWTLCYTRAVVDELHWILNSSQHHGL